MTDTSISMKSIEDLQHNPEDSNKPYRFFVPSYQRGYRWGKEEVSALMDDLSVFFDTQTIHHDYCLQPIVVKPREDGSYEVIDGQQRLTTLLLLMQYSDPFKSGGNYSIAYATRPDSREFLHSLNADSPATSEHAEDNPDFHHMALALETMRNWAREHGKDRPDMFNFLSVFRRRTKVIWYEITSGKDESIDLFRKINVGKIPLTNAELVKGLLLSDDGFDANEKRAVANEWDRMEHRLQDDALWCFLTNDIEGEYQTRIDLILDIWLKAQDDAPAIDHTHNRYAVFNHVYGGGHDNGCQTLLRDMWRSCKEIFANLEYWFENRELYHLIGYLVARRKTDKKTDVLDLYAQLSNCDKSELRGRLRTLIGKDIDLEQIPDLTYNDSDKTRNALLLFNLLTLNASTGSPHEIPIRPL